MALIKNYKNGKPHEVVVALIEKENKILLLKRTQPPISYAGSSGHVDEGETFEEAIDREVKEELNLKIIDKDLLLEKMISLYPCRYDGEKRHLVRVYSIKYEGKISFSKDEFEDFVWVDKRDLIKYKLDPMWKDFLIDLGYLNV